MSGASGSGEPVRSSKHKNSHWDEKLSDSVGEGREPSFDEDTAIQYNGARVSNGAVFSYNLPCSLPTFFFSENMDGHQAMLVYIENHLQQDRMWQISLKAQQTPVKIPDVMRQYRTISRVFRELVGKKLDNGHTIFKVSKLFPYKLNDDFLSEYDTEPYMRNHGN
jgi:hypothetical protein